MTSSDRRKKSRFRCRTSRIGRRNGVVDRGRSLQDLDGQDWGEPSYPSRLVTECHRLRRIPLRDFTVEDLRIMIGQSIGLEYLAPLALERLRDDPLAEGDLYPGDLLMSALRADAAFWRIHPELREQLAAVAERAIAVLQTRVEADPVSRHDLRNVTRAFDVFRKQQAPAV